MANPFYGRQEELDRLQRLLKKKTSSLVVIKGRRRIGKSRLILEYAKGMKSLIFTGMPPEQGVTEQDQRAYFTQQMERQLPSVRGLRHDDWGDIFWNLSKETQKGRILIVLDEVNYSPLKRNLQK